MPNKIKIIKKLVSPLIEKVEHDNIFAIAGQCAFFTIITVFPLAMFAVSVLQNFHLPVETFQNILNDVLNEKASEYVSEVLSSAYKDASGISVITMLVTLWTSAQGIHIITNGLNRIHGTYENRNWILLRLRAVFLTVIFFIIIICSMLIVVLGSTINELLQPYIKYVPDIVELIYNLRYFLFYIYLIFLFALLYKNAPNLEKDVRHEFGMRNQLPGAILCATSWYALSFGISIYVDNFNGFSIYGSLTKLAIIMMWIYLCVVFFMLGAEINFVYHKNIMNFRFRKKKLRKNKT